MLGCTNIDNSSTSSNKDSNAIIFDDSFNFSSNQWFYDADVDTLFKVKSDGVKTWEEAIEDLNRRFCQKIKIDLIAKNNDTIFLKIDSAQYLTQQIGSTGAYGYMAVVTYTLTDYTGIEFVNFDFEEGDHASPGTYDRKELKRR